MLCSSTNSIYSLIFIIEKPRVPELDLGFAISARAIDSNKNFKTMKDTIKKISEKYGTNKIRYALLVYGSSPTIYIPFRSTPVTSEDLASYLDSARINDRGADLDKALEEAKKMFLDARPTAKKVLVVIADKRSESYPDEIKVCTIFLKMNE